MTEPEVKLINMAKASFGNIVKTKLKQSTNYNVDCEHITFEDGEIHILTTSNCTIKFDCKEFIKISPEGLETKKLKFSFTPSIPQSEINKLCKYI